MHILEPCCKLTQFKRALEELERFHQTDITHYGDVLFHEWFTQLILQARGSHVHFRFRTLDLTTLNYILNRMRDHAFIPGKNLSVIETATIQARHLPNPIPQRAQLLIQQGRLTIQTLKRSPKQELITITLPSSSPSPSAQLVQSGSPALPSSSSPSSSSSSLPSSPSLSTPPSRLLPALPQPTYTLSGIFFASLPNTPRTINLKKLSNHANK